MQPGTQGAAAGSVWSMKDMTLRNALMRIGLAGLLSLPGAFSASADTAMATVTISVNVIADPCVINGDNPIDVDFGNELLINKVDGINYRKPVDYSLDCGYATLPALKMMIGGSGASFDDTVLQASQTGLGIALMHDGQPLPLNSWLNFAPGTKPALEAVPVKAPGIKLAAGGFSAVATITVEYQ